MDGDTSLVKKGSGPGQPKWEILRISVDLMETTTSVQLTNSDESKNAGFSCGDESISGRLESERFEPKGSLLVDSVILGVSLEK